MREADACSEAQQPEAQAARDDHTRDVERPRAQRHAHTNFAGALGDGVSEHAVNADTGEHQRQSRENPKKDHGALAIRNIVLDDGVHTASARERLLGIHGPNSTTHGIRGTQRILLRAHDKIVGPGTLDLLSRKIDGGLHAEQQAALANVRYDTHNRAHGSNAVRWKATLRTRADAKVFAECALCRPVTLRQEFIDYDNGLRGFDVAVLKETSLNKPRANRAEVSRRDLAIKGVIPHAGLGRRLALYGIALGIPFGGEGRIGSKTCADNSRFTAQLLRDVVIEAPDFRVGVILGLRQGQDGHKQVVGTEPEVHLVKVPQSLNHQPGADQKS